MILYMTFHNKIFKVIMQQSTINSTIKILYGFIGINTGTVPFCSLRGIHN